MHRLTDGQVKHSPEVFYAGSLWKVFNTNYSVLSFSGVPSIFFPPGIKVLVCILMV